MLNASIEAYCYSVLGALVKTRISVVAAAAAALESQEVFRTIVNDSIVNY